MLLHLASRRDSVFIKSGWLYSTQRQQQWVCTRPSTLKPLHSARSLILREGLVPEGLRPFPLEKSCVQTRLQRQRSGCMGAKFSPMDPSSHVLWIWSEHRLFKGMAVILQERAFSKNPSFGRMQRLQMWAWCNHCCCRWVLSKSAGFYEYGSLLEADAGSMGYSDFLTEVPLWT